MRALRRILSLALTTSLLFQQIGFAQIATELNIASHLSRMASSLAIDKFRPLHLRYFSYDPDSNNFKFLFDKGDLKQLEDAKFKEESSELLKYFLIGITLPDSKFWVNLRPDSSDQIIEPELEQTDLGKVLLEADLQLKKDTARYTSPETPEGKEYWNKLYKKAEELFGLENVTIPTLTRPWIVPGEIIVRETQESAFIYKSTLKVMLEQDYIKESSSPLAAAYSFKDPRQKILNEYSSQVIRELIIPKLTKEVNTSKKYANLRQVFYSLILSRWFKARFQDKKGLSPKLVPEGEGTVPFYVNLIDSKNLNGLTSKESWSKTTYFEQYKKSFADGEYNLKEQVYTPTGQVIRSYFSGGFAMTDLATTYSGVGARAIGDVNLRNPNLIGAVASPVEGTVLPNITQQEINDGKAAAGSPMEALKQELITKGLNSEIMDKLLKAVKKPVILGQNAFSVSVGESRVRFFLLEVSERKSSHYPFYSIIFGGAKGEMLSIAVPVSGKMDAIEIGARKFDINALTLVSDIADNIMKALNSAAGSPLQKDPIYDALRKRLAYIETYFALLDDGVKELAGDFGPNVFRPLVDDDMEKGQKKIPGMIKQRGETILDGPQVYESLGLVVSTNDKKEIIAVVKRFSNLFTVPLDDSEGILQRLSQNMDEEIADTAKAAIERMKDRQDEIVKLTAGSPVTVHDVLKEPIIKAFNEYNEIVRSSELSSLSLPAAQLILLNEVIAIKAAGSPVTTVDLFYEFLDSLRSQMNLPVPQYGEDMLKRHGGGADVRRYRNEYALLQEFIAYGLSNYDKFPVFHRAEFERAAGQIVKDYYKGSSPLTTSETSSPMNTGGIDFRVMNIVTQPLVASSSLNLKLPQSANLARINLDEELKQMKNMLAAKIAPSGERFKEVMASSALKGEWDRRIPEIISCLVDVCRLEEDNLSETPLGIKEALIIADSANF